MSVTNVYHRTRDRIYKMNFSASGETSCPFTAEADGEIYAVESNNVSSYTINGAPVSLPFLLTDGNSYTVSIIKTNVGQTADITFKSRRGTEKLTSQNVPFYRVFDKLYILSEDTGKVMVVDPSMLSESNYQGAGVYTNSPLLTTIQLPALNVAHTYSIIFYNEIDSIPYMYVVAPHRVRVWGTNNVHVYVCRINCNTDSVESLEGTADSLTDIGGLPYSIYDHIGMTNFSFDFVNNSIFYTGHNGWRYLNLNTYSGNRCLGSDSPRQFVGYYNPVDNRVKDYPSTVQIGDGRYILNESAASGVYDQEHNGYWRWNSYQNRFYCFDYKGNIVVQHLGNPLIPGGVGFHSKKGNYHFVLSINSNVLIFNVIDSISAYSSVIDNLVSSIFHMCYTSTDGRKFSAIENNGRLHTFLLDANDNLVQQYFDLPETASIITVNEHLRT